MSTSSKILGTSFIAAGFLFGQPLMGYGLFHALKKYTQLIPTESLSSIQISMKTEQAAFSLMLKNRLGNIYVPPPLSTILGMGSYSLSWHAWYTEKVCSLAEKFLSSDTTQQQAEIHHDLQEDNEQMILIREEYRKTREVFSLLYSQFNPAAQEARTYIDTIKKAEELYQKGAQKLIAEHKEINPHEIKAALFSLMASVESLLAHNGTHIATLIQQRDTLLQSQKTLQEAEKDYTAVSHELIQEAEEVKKLYQEIVAAGLEQSETAKALLEEIAVMIKDFESQGLLTGKGDSHHGIVVS